MKKYMILFPIEGQPGKAICTMMDNISVFTEKPQPYLKLITHMTFHRPIKGVDEKKLIDIAISAAKRLKKTRITVSGLYHFGKKYIVLPVHATLVVAMVWSDLFKEVSQFKQYEHSDYDHDNTLHITIGEDLVDVFDTAWPKIQRNCIIDAMDIIVDKIEIWSKSDRKGSKWRRVKSIPLPDK
jgi:2'-5' RNA ligase